METRFIFLSDICLTNFIIFMSYFPVGAAVVVVVVVFAAERL